MAVYSYVRETNLSITKHHIMSHESKQCYRPPNIGECQTGQKSTYVPQRNERLSWSWQMVI